jgi:CDP-diacylglycerol---glycerol-3-phosphate 3-phosphatidyltransferase
MKSLYELKPRFQDVLRPYANAMARAGVSPDFVTLAALALSALSGLLIAIFADAQTPLLILALALPVRMALNAIDGMLAREHKRETPGGRLLNEICDVASDLFMYLPLMLVPEFSPFLVVLAVIMAVLSEVAGLAATSIGAARRHDGPMGKADRALAFGFLALLAATGVLPALVINLVLALIVGLGFLTIINRVNSALEEHAALEQAKAAPASSSAAPK